MRKVGVPAVVPLTGIRTDFPSSSETDARPVGATSTLPSTTDTVTCVPLSATENVVPLTVTCPARVSTVSFELESRDATLNDATPLTRRTVVIEPNVASGSLENEAKSCPSTAEGSFCTNCATSIVVFGSRPMTVPFASTIFAEASALVRTAVFSVKTSPAASCFFAPSTIVTTEPETELAEIFPGAAAKAATEAKIIASTERILIVFMAFGFSG